MPGEDKQWLIWVEQQPEWLNWESAETNKGSASGVEEVPEQQGGRQPGLEFNGNQWSQNQVEGEPV